MYGDFFVLWPAFLPTLVTLVPTNNFLALSKPLTTPFCMKYINPRCELPVFTKAKCFCQFYKLLTRVIYVSSTLFELPSLKLWYDIIKYITFFHFLSHNTLDSSVAYGGFVFQVPQRKVLKTSRKQLWCLFINYPIFFLQICYMITQIKISYLCYMHN